MDEGLFRAIYPELRRLAAGMLRRERVDHTLQGTALVHEAMLRLLKNSRRQDLSTQELQAMAAHQMRQILVDYARKHRTRKRGGDRLRVPMAEFEGSLTEDVDAFLALNEALDKLGTIDARALSVVELKFFQGCTTDESAAILGVSDGTVEADWQFARSWLFGELNESKTLMRV